MQFHRISRLLSKICFPSLWIMHVLVLGEYWSLIPNFIYVLFYFIFSHSTLNQNFMLLALKAEAFRLTSRQHDSKCQNCITSPAGITLPIQWEELVWDTSGHPPLRAPNWLWVLSPDLSGPREKIESPRSIVGIRMSSYEGF